MSDTPKTNAAEHDIDEIPEFPFVCSNFARRLERERDKWKAECKRQWVYLSHARHNACEIQNIQWGHDGACGADRLANLIEEDCHRGMMSMENAERIHGGAGLLNQSEMPTPLDDASC